MKINNALTQLQKDSTLKQVDIARALNMSQPAIAKKFKQDNIGTDTLIDVLSLLGYELVIQPKKQGRRPEGQIVITKEEQ